MKIDPGVGILLIGVLLLVVRYCYRNYLERNDNAEIDDKVRLISMLWGGIIAILSGSFRLLYLLFR